MRCPSCDHDNRSDRRFCARCGSRLGELCAACGTQNDPDENFCGNCGAALAGAPAPATPSAPYAEREGRGAADAERRQLTVMFCDLVASTALAERIEAEDLREIVRRYYDDCAETIRRWEGHVAQYLGDGVLAYFGYPCAHEDDAERAVRAGLDMLRTLAHDFADLNAVLETERGIRLAARIGLHTGPVVVGDMAGDSRREALALGETVNIAARLQAIAASDAVVISGATLRLVRGIFVIEDLGRQGLKGIAEPVAVYRVVQPSGVRSRLDIAEGKLTPFVGRHAELAVLLESWERIQERNGQTVVITGEAGVGKSRLVLALRERLADQAHTWLECHCSPYTQHSAFRPVIELVEHGFALRAAETPAEKIAKLERALALARFPLPETVPLFADFLSIPLTDAYVPPQMSSELQRRKTLEALAAWNLAQGELQPVLIVVEDLQWCDPSSLELLGRLIEQSPTARVMLVCTARPDFQSPWPARSNLTPLQLGRLTKRQAREMVAALRPGRALPEAVVDLLVTHADGVPLYVEELARMVLDSKLVVERDGRYEVTAPINELAIPTTLQDSLMARLDRLSAAKEVAQRASVLGREFPYALLAATAGLDEPTLCQGLARLVDAELCFQRGEPPAATYTFKHALIQEAAYQSLLKRTRQQLHARVAEVLMEQFPAQAEAAAEVVARHCESAGLIDQAVTQYQRGGEQAAARSAHEEAISHLRRGIALLAELPEGADRDGREAPLQLALAASLIAARGYAHAEIGAAYERVRALPGLVGDPAQRMAALYGLSVFHAARGELQRAAELAQWLLALARETEDTDYLPLAHVQIAVPELYQGKFASSLSHCEESIENSSLHHHWTAPKYGTDPGGGALFYAALNLWLLGYPDRALQRAQEAVALARTVNHPFGLATSLFWESVVHWLRRDPAAQRARAEEAIALSDSHGFPLWLGAAKAFRGAARASAGADATGVAEMSEGLALAAGSGTQAAAPALSALLAEAQHAVGRPAEALVAVETGLAVAAQTGQSFFDAELHRLKGELLLAAPADSATEAEALFHHAREIARAQEARSLALRAAMSLARLWREQGKRTEARAVVAPVYAWFTEGFATRDLIDAKALLEDLS